MLTAEGCLARRDRLWASVPEPCQWVMVTDPRHVHYLCNFWVNPLSFSAGDSAILVLRRDDEDLLFADNFVRRTAVAEPHAVTEHIDAWYTHKKSVTSRTQALMYAMGDFIPGSVRDKLENETGEIEFGAAIAQLFATNSPAVSDDDPYVHPFVDCSGVGDAIRLLRRQKDPDEIALMKQCMRAGEAGHARAREVIQPGMTEFDIYREVQEAATAAAGQPVLVYGDFRATNTVTHKAGGLPTHYELQPGDLFILDYSVVIAGYRSDFTNTYAVTEASDESARMALTCIEAIMSGEAALKPGASGIDVYTAVSEILERDGHGPLTHHAGHGIGLSHPEPPILVPESVDTLLVGDVITLEPGIYKEGVGGMRFEHNYLITETGFERLSDHVLGF